jgi:hypothetical protein
MKLYSIEIQICATAYIKAESAEEAMKIAKELKGDILEIDEQDGELPISGREYDNPNLPDISLSPAMTVEGPCENETPDCVHDDDGEEA